MPFIIEDGLGSGKKAGVNNVNEQRTFAIVLPIEDRATIEEERYNINTGNVTLNSTGESAMLWVENLGDDPLIITGLVYNLGDSTGGSGTAKVDVYRNPTSGTIVSTSSVVSAAKNMNFGSGKTLNGKFLAGAQSLTQTGGEFAIGSLVPAQSRTVIALGAVVLPKGKTLSVTVTPPAGNTSMLANIAASIYRYTPKVSG